MPDLEPVIDETGNTLTVLKVIGSITSRLGS